MRRIPGLSLLALLFLLGSLSACTSRARSAGDDDDAADDDDASDDDDAVDEQTVIGVANIDDDNGDGERDWGGGGSASDPDLVELVLQASAFDLGSDDTGRLVLNATDDLRVWHEGTVVLGYGVGDEWDIGQVPEDGVVLQVEFGGFLTRGSLLPQRVNEGEVVSDGTPIPLLSSPVMLTWAYLEADEVWLVDEPNWGGNADMVDVFEEVLGSTLTLVDADDVDHDVWIQDEHEVAAMTAPGHSTDLVIDSIRDRGLDDWVGDLLGPDTAVRTWGGGGGLTLDSFGNLEVSPPVTVDGVDYPLGRIFYGGTASQHPAQELLEFLQSQQVQAPFMVDSTWTCVGHVGSLVTFVPDPDAEHGFRLAVADTDAGWALLESLPSSGSLGRYAESTFGGSGYDSVADLLGDTTLQMNNVEYQVQLDDMVEVLMTELDLTEEDLIRLPSVLYEETGCGAAELVPGPASLFVVRQDGVDHAFLPDPFFRSGTTASSQGDDPFIEAARDLLPGDLELHFVDTWDVYHLGLGGVCTGTNSRRILDVAWWEEAGHLLD